MDKLYKLAEQFRTAMDSARRDREFIKLSPLSSFPDGCCDLTSELLKPFLKENGYDTVLINGKSKRDHSSRHVWLLYKGNIIIDITGDQFNGKLKLQTQIDSVYVGRGNEIHNIFSLEQIQEQPTIYRDPICFTGFNRTPSKREYTLAKAESIIQRFLSQKQYTSID